MDDPGAQENRTEDVMKVKRYVIGRDKDDGFWFIFDRWRGHIIEGGYTWAGARYAANFHNYKALGAGPWRS